MTESFNGLSEEQIRKMFEKVHETRMKLAPEEFHGKTIDGLWHYDNSLVKARYFGFIEGVSAMELSMNVESDPIIQKPKLILT